MVQEYVITTMYQFFSFENYQLFQPRLLAFCEQQQIKGTVLLAEEGINGTLAGSRAAIDALYQYLQATPGLHDLEYKESYANEIPFHRIRVKLKQEIVSLGKPDIQPAKQSGVKIAPKDWNKIISDKEVLLVDTRNEYEHQIGTFKGATSPKTNHFRQFPNYVKQQLDPQNKQKIALFCTGGIRCEKASAYLLEQGFETVYQLRGGILKYLAEIPEDESLWQGECFVFDSRVSVDRHLAKGQYLQCFACRRPLTKQDLNADSYEQGVSCPHCINDKTSAQRTACKERQHQVELAEQRNEKHIGAKMPG